MSARAAASLAKQPKSSPGVRKAPSAAVAGASLLSAPAAAFEVAGAAAAAAVRAENPDTPGSRRGSLALALAAAESRDDLNAAIADLLRDRYSPTSLRSRESWLRTWVTMHEAAYSKEAVRPGPFPLTAEGITRVAALFKRGGYHSFENYGIRA